MAQYFSLLRLRNTFPYLHITKNVDTHASPTKAAEMKQFWYPMFSTHGVILSSH